jgi:signal transduction histidine kinase
LVALAATSFVGLRIASRVALPLTDMVREIAEVPNRGSLVEIRFTVTEDEPREVQDLKRALNAAHHRLGMEISRRQLLTAVVAHDLKAPLTGTIRLLEAVSDGGRDESASSSWLRPVLAEQHRMLALVQSLVDAARVEQGRRVAERVRVDLKDVMDRVAAAVVRRDGVEVVVSGAGHGFGDIQSIERALTNLVENAVRHARTRVRATLYQGLVRIEDDGSGLPGPLDLLSRPFVGMSDKSQEGAPAGAAGLGLYIARQLLEAQGGRVTLESTSDSGTILLAYVPTS